MSEEDIAEYIKYDTETPEKFSAYDKMINEDGTFVNDRKVSSGCPADEAKDY